MSLSFGYPASKNTVEGSIVAELVMHMRVMVPADVIRTCMSIDCDRITVESFHLPNYIHVQWTVQGKLRIGFFTVRKIAEGQEVTFDYQFQRFGYDVYMI